MPDQAQTTTPVKAPQKKKAAAKAPKPVSTTVPAEVTESDITPEQAEIAQLKGILAVQDERIRELAGFQAQARDLADGNAALTEQLAAATSERDQAVKQAALSHAAALNATTSATVDQGVVAHAQALAAAVKGLLG